MTLLPALNIYNLPVLIAAFLNVGLVVFIYLRSSWQPIHRAFAGWNLALAVWNLGASGIYGAVSEPVALWWSRFCCLAIVWIPATFLHLVLLLQDHRTQRQQRFLIGTYVLGALLFVLNLLWPNFLVERAIPRFWGWAPVGGPGTALLDPLLAASSIYSLVLLRSALRHAQDARRNQLLYVFWSTLIAFIGGGINVLAIHGANIYPFGNLINSIYSLILAYAILEHGLMDIRIILRRGTVYALLSGSMTIVYISLVAVLQRLFGHYGVQENVAFYTAAFPVTVILAPTMKTRIEPFVEHTLFKEAAREGSPPHTSQEMTLMGILATEMAHEITKPLTHIMNAGSRMKGSDQAASRENLRTIERETQRVAEILDGFAMLSPDRKLHRIDVHVSDLLKEAVKTLGVEADGRIRIVRDYAKSPRCAVNPGQLVQVFTNLIQNAWQAMPDGGVLTLSIRSIQLPRKTLAIEVAVSDTGKGIPAELQKKVFEPFFTTKQNQGGRGIGLTISQAMVERHGGTIAIQSPITATGGTRVVVQLPIILLEEESHAT